MATCPEAFTRRVFASADCYDLELMIDPATDLDDSFRAWDVDSGEELRVNGWLFTFEEGEA